MRDGLAKDIRLAWTEYFGDARPDEGKVDYP